MLADPRPVLQHHLRAYLGTDHITALEATMASVLESLQNLAAQQQAASAAQLTSFSNLQGAVQRLEQAVRSGEASPEIQQAVADLSAGFTTMLADAQRADDGYEPTPTPENPETPAEPEAPVDVPAEPEAPVDVPAEPETPEVPVEPEAPADETPVDESTTRRRR